MLVARPAAAAGRGAAGQRQALKRRRAPAPARSSTRAVAARSGGDSGSGPSSSSSAGGSSRAAQAEGSSSGSSSGSSEASTASGSGGSWLAGEAQLLATWWPEARRTFPAVPWGPSDLVTVMGASLAAAAAFALLSATLLAPPPPPGAGDAADALASAAAAAASGAGQQLPEALRHLAREGALAALLPAAVLVALARYSPQSAGLLAARWEPAWAARTAALCAVLFPCVDPLLYHAWAPVAEAVFGPPAASTLVPQLQAAAGGGEWGAVGAHLAASGIVGPIWEEVFWRGFFLASLTKVLPLPACVALSSLNFAALHLSPANFLPLLVLSAACDCLYLRTHNLMPPLLLHCAWNSSQVLAIALLGKAEFV